MLGDLWDKISGWMGDTMSSILESILHATIFRLFYYVERMLCWIVGLLYEMFEVFAGLVRVNYDGENSYLINIFFSNKAVSNIYWAMALIGIALTFGFTIAAVVRKMFDSSGKQQQSLGQIIFGGLRSIVVILGMTAIMSVVLNGTGVLMQQVNYIFTDPYNLHLPEERSFTGEEYAAMARVLNTIGNYSVSESKDNRYNLNLCFNDIRKDLYYLQQQGVFEQTYYNTDKDGNLKKSWQYVLAQVALSANLKQDVTVDEYHDSISRPLLEAMDYLKTNANPRPVPSVTRRSFTSNEANLDRMIFLMGTFRAAKNPEYNESPSLDDAVRGPYYYGTEKSIYDFKQVDHDFNIGFATDYIVVWIAAIAIIFDLVVIILNCVARIFNMLFLYLIAPPVIAAQPLDNGAKTKQWMTAFLVQSLSVFGTVIAMRLLMLFLPLIISPKLVLFPDSPILDSFAKLILVYGGFEAAKKSSSILTGILADSAGWQAVQAGDMSSTADKALGAARKVGGTALGVAGFVAAPLTNRLASPFQKMANAWKNSGSAKYDIQAKEEHKMNEARKPYQEKEKEKQSQGGSSGGGSGSGKSSSPPPTPSPAPPPAPVNQNTQNSHNSQNQNHQSNQQNQQNQQNQNRNQNRNQQNQNHPAQPVGQQPANPINNQGPQPANPVNNLQQPGGQVNNQGPRPANPVNNQQQPVGQVNNQGPRPANPINNQQQPGGPQPANPVNPAPVNPVQNVVNNANPVAQQNAAGQFVGQHVANNVVPAAVEAANNPNNPNAGPDLAPNVRNQRQAAHPPVVPQNLQNQNQQ